MRRLFCVLALLATACTPAATEGGQVTLAEFSIDTPQRFRSGDVALEIVNQGDFGHTLVVSTTDGTVVGSTDVLGPGDGGVLDLELEPGDYVFSCRIVVETPDGQIVDHYASGMAANVVVVP